MKLRSDNFSLARISDLKQVTIEEAYLIYFNRWKFDNSDKVWLDDELLTNQEKQLIMGSNYNIKPKSTIVTISEEQENISLTEKLFINEQLRSFEEIKSISKGVGTDRVLYSKSQAYIKFLKERLSKSSSNNKEEKKKIYLKDIVEKHMYDNLIMKLKKAAILKDSNNSFKIVSQDNDLEEGRLASSLGYVLKNKEYLKPNIKDVDIFRALNNSLGVKLTAKSYSASKKAFNDDGEKARNYITTWFFL